MENKPTIEEKVDAIIRHLTLDYKLFHAISEKNEHVKKQEFEAAVKSRANEVAIRNEFLESSKKLQEMVESKSIGINR